MNMTRATKNGYTLGLALAHGARRAPGARIHLDRPMDAFPDAGVDLDYATVARLARETEAGLAAAGVAPGQRVAIVKRNHIDIYILATAVARLGAVPALLSAELDPLTLAALLGRLRADVLLTQVATWTAGPLAELDPVLLSKTVLAVDGSPAGAAPLPSVTERREPPLLPRTGTTKVRRFEAREMLSGGRL
jgi:acyl-CoA synthetase (AMP-forming)/AMP-acid ligase II